MKNILLGHGGLRVSDFCLGTMTFGHGTNQSEAREIVSVALDAGINFFDTANSYSGGESERMLGEALVGCPREDVVIATKFTNPMGNGPNDFGWSRLHIMKAVEESLKRLGTDYIDLYYIHHTDDAVPIEETLRTLDLLVKQGKIRYIGCSNFEAWRLADAFWTSISSELEKFLCYQGGYNLVMRDVEEDILPFIRKKRLGFVAYWNLAGGFLSGKYRSGQRKLPGTRSEEGWVFPAGHFHTRADEILSVFLDAAESIGADPAALAIAWVRSREWVSANLIGARTPKQLHKNLQADSLEIPAELLEKLDKASLLPPRYPRWMEENRQGR